MRADNIYRIRPFRWLLSQLSQGTGLYLPPQWALNLKIENTEQIRLSTKYVMQILNCLKRLSEYTSEKEEIWVAQTKLHTNISVKKYSSPVIFWFYYYENIRPDYKVGRVMPGIKERFIIGNWSQSGATRARDIIIAKSCPELPNIPHNLRGRWGERGERCYFVALANLLFINSPSSYPSLLLCNM